MSDVYLYNWQANKRLTFPSEAWRDFYLNEVDPNGSWTSFDSPFVHDYEDEDWLRDVIACVGDSTCTYAFLYDLFSLDHPDGHKGISLDELMLVRDKMANFEAFLDDFEPFDVARNFELIANMVDVCEWKDLISDARRENLPLDKIVDGYENWELYRDAHRDHGLSYSDLFCGC